MKMQEWYTLIALTINALGLIITIFKITKEQKISNALKQKEDKRIEYKLRIYHSLLAKILTVPEIIQDFKAHNPSERDVDEVELRKCIYEMFVEDTICSYEDGTYTANTNDDEEDDEDEDPDGKFKEKKPRKRTTTSKVKDKIKTFI